MPEIPLYPAPPTAPGEYLLEFYSLGYTQRVLAVVGRDGKRLTMRVNGIQWDDVRDFIEQHKCLWSAPIAMKREEELRA